MTDRDAAVDAVMDVACSPDFIHGKHMHGIGGASQNRDCQYCAVVRAAVEQAIADARIDETMRVPCTGCGSKTKGHISDGKRICGCSISTIQCARCSRLAELERQRGAR